MPQTVEQTLNTVVSTVSVDADVVLFVVSARPTDSTRTRLNAAHIEAARNALNAVLGVVGVDVRSSATVGRIEPVELSDGETLRLAVAATLEKTSPDETPEETETEPTPEGGAE